MVEKSKVGVDLLRHLNRVYIVDFLIGFLLISFLFLFHIRCSIFDTFAISGFRSGVSREGCRKAEGDIMSVYDENIFG
jgi:hypothetical protein